MNHRNLDPANRQARTIGAALYRAGVPSGEIIKAAESRHWFAFEAVCTRLGGVYNAAGAVCLGWREAADRDRRRCGVSVESLRLALWLGAVVVALLIVTGLNS